jgi:hypothetical protein
VVPVTAAGPYETERDAREAAMKAGDPSPAQFILTPRQR